MMLPPTSGRKAVRHRNASSVVALSNIYGFLISIWINSSPQEKSQSPAPPGWIREFRLKLIALAEQIHTVGELTELAKWEGSIRGAWPAEEYTRLIDVQTEMISSLAQVGPAFHNESSTDKFMVISSLVAHWDSSTIIGDLPSCTAQKSSTPISCVFTSHSLVAELMAVGLTSLLLDCRCDVYLLSCITVPSNRGTYPSSPSAYPSG